MTDQPDDESSVAPTSGMLSAALDYALRGWRVIPIIPGGKRPAIPAWTRDATTDPQTIRHWWTGPGRECGVGIVTGHGSGLWVLDVDVHPGRDGRDTLADLIHEHGPLPDTPTVITGSGGRHLYFRWPGWDPGTTAGRLGPGLDVRADGGQVVAPPTIHPGGRPYQWELSPDEVDVACAPDWLLDLLRPSTRRQRPRATLTTTDRPGDRWAATVSFADLLERDGATWLGDRVHRDGRRYSLWARPGLTGRDLHTSATLWSDSQTLVVFSTNWPGLEAGRTYSQIGYAAAVRGLSVEEFAGELRAGENETISGIIAKTVAAQHDPETVAAQHDPDDSDMSGPIVRIVTGAQFVLDDTVDQDPRWGRGHDVLWARGESLIIAGPPGVGKTTLAGQLVAALIGLRTSVLGLPVTPAGRVLYLAMDRPQQLRRAFRRLFHPEHRPELEQKLLVHPGPLSKDLGRHPEHLMEMCRDLDVDVVIIDSLKDAAVKLVDDEIGGNVNRAIQWCLSAGIDVLALHHQRKGVGGEKPTKLEDLYGSSWISAGAGSVILLWGEAGSETVEMTHLKQPMDPVGPWHVEHDHQTGESVVSRGFDVLAFIRSRPDGVTVAEVAQAATGRVQTSGSASWKRAERRLRRLVADGLATHDSGGAIGRPGVYRPT